MPSNPNFSQQFAGQYNTFSGVDIHAVFGGTVLLEVQGISYTVSREVAPVYTMGHAEPRSFTKGKRGIAGTLVFSLFDRHALLEGLAERSIFWADAEEVTAMNQRLSAGNSSIRPAGAGSFLDPARVGVAVPAVPWYEDQIPPFNIVLTALNESGAQMRMDIRGVHILNQGQGMSIDDMTMDQQMTFVAISVTPWRAGQYTPASRARALHQSAVAPIGSVNPNV